MYALTITRPSKDLKCLDGPARNVNPEIRPPSISADKAKLIMGTSVGTGSFLLKKVDSLSNSADLMEPDFLIFSNKLIIFLCVLIVLKRGTTPLNFYLYCKESSKETF
jgi:hypothetical protein